jgi:hypothetical protein
MTSDSEDKKKPYSTPTLTKLTPEQAKKLVVDRKKYSEEEAAELLKSLRKQPPNDATDQKRKHSG